MRGGWRIGLAVAAVVALAAGAWAQAAPDGNGVARLSWRAGEVSIQRGAAGAQAAEEPAAWTPGRLNTPLLAGDRVATAVGAQAEIALDYADFLRLDGNAQATLITLRSNSLQASLEHGRADLAILHGAQANAEVDTPLVAVRPQGESVIRIEVNSADETVITVRAGAVEVSTTHGSARVKADETMTVLGADDPQYQIVDAAAPDDWDNWNAARDRRIEDAQSWAYADTYYAGLNDLDGYGRWIYVAGYGRVWAPVAGPDWAPYSAGAWVNEPYWGWTWVSSEPWGWAPYHYGRWFVFDAQWVWWPGPVMAEPLYRPVYAPAYVGFISLQSGAMGWVALGPGDAMRPWWGGPAVRMSVVAPLAPVTARVRYANLELMVHDPLIARAVVTVPAGRFGAGAVVREHVGVAELQQAAILRGEALPHGSDAQMQARMAADPPPAGRDAPAGAARPPQGAQRGNAPAARGSQTEQDKTKQQARKDKPRKQQQDSQCCRGSRERLQR